MIRPFAFAVAVLLGIVLLCGVVNAEQRSARRGRARPFLAPPPSRPLDQQESQTLRQANPYAYWREIYPQFYGGFHYRQIYEFGPPGDFGFRGSPW